MVLDLFVSVFKADTKDFEDGIKKVNKSTDDIVKELKTAQSKSKNIFSQIAEDMQKAYNTEDVTRLNAESLNAFFDGIKKHGLTVDEAKESILDLMVGVDEAVTNLDSSQAKVFEDFNISLKNTDGSAKDLIVILDELLQTTNNVNDDRLQEVFNTLNLQNGKFNDAIIRSKKEINDLSKTIRNAKDEAQIAQEKLISFAKGATGFLASFFTISKGIGTAISQADKLVTLNQVADSLDTNVQSLDAFTKALQENGAESTATEESLRSVFTSTATALENVESEQAKTFKSLGISLRDTNGNIKETTDLMMDLAGASENLDKGQSTNLFKKLGITDKRVIDNLLKGRKELEANIKKQKENNTVTQRQIDIANKYSDAQNKLNGVLETSKNAIMELLAPAITWLIDKFSAVVDWMNKHQAFVIGFFGAIAVAVSTLYLPAMIKAGIATFTALSPLLLIATAIGVVATVIALLVDDINEWINGGDSLIGQLISFEDVMNIVNGTLDALRDGFDWTVEAIKDFANAFYETVVSIKDGVVANFNIIKDFIMSLIDSIFGAIDKIKSGMGAVKSFLGFGDKDININENKNENKKQETKFLKESNDKTNSKSENDYLANNIKELNIENKEIKNINEINRDTKNINEINKDIENIKEVNKDIQLANETVKSANTNPINKTSSQQISNLTKSQNNEQNIGIGQITINTNATDSKEISKDIRSDLENQLKSLQAENYSGVEI